MRRDYKSSDISSWGTSCCHLVVSTVVSPLTRKTYRFEKPGARIEVDLRDRSWIAFVPSLVPAD